MELYIAEYDANVTWAGYGPTLNFVDVVGIGT